MLLNHISLERENTDTFEWDIATDEALRPPILNIQYKKAPVKQHGNVIPLSQRPESKKNKILVIDDSATIRKLLLKILENMGLDVRSAVDGYDALSQLQQFKPNLIITDLMMPKMNGITLINKIHRKEQFMHIPVIVITHNLSPNCFENLSIFGAADVLGKPFKSEEIRSMVSKFISVPELSVQKKSHNNIGVISDSPYQRSAISRTLTRNGYQIAISSDFSNLRTCLKTSSDKINAWIISITQDGQIEVMDELEQQADAPMLMGVEIPPSSHDNLYSKWENSLLGKLDGILA